MIVDRLHTLTHEMPGVPEHRAHNRAHQNPGSRNANRAHRHATREHGEPRVLVRWQRWIASLGARSSSRPS